jgi:hypothetical protein
MIMNRELSIAVIASGPNNNTIPATIYESEWLVDFALRH